jgi:hypothetical protein
MEKEIWKPIPSQPGMMASSCGRVLLPERTAQMPHGGWRTYTPIPTYGCKRKASKTAKHEYYGLFHKERGNLKIHRLVCEAFHGPSPFPKAVVIHLDEDALNNRPENLKWGTQKENLNMPKFIAYCKSRTGENSPSIKGRKNALEISPRIAQAHEEYSATI